MSIFETFFYINVRLIPFFYKYKYIVLGRGAPPKYAKSDGKRASKTGN